jgi:hypothetical protein
MVSEGLAKAAPGYIESLGEDPSLSGDGHEIGITNPAWEHVHVDVTGDSGASGFAQIHAQVDAVGMVGGAESALGVLG